MTASPVDPSPFRRKLCFNFRCCGTLSFPQTSSQTHHIQGESLRPSNIRFPLFRFFRPHRRNVAVSSHCRLKSEARTIVFVSAFLRSAAIETCIGESVGSCCVGNRQRGEQSPQDSRAKLVWLDWRAKANRSGSWTPIVDGFIRNPVLKRTSLVACSDLQTSDDIDRLPGAVALLWSAGCDGVFPLAVVAGTWRFARHFWF
jgi:hypothetical protein